MNIGDEVFVCHPTNSRMLPLVVLVAGRIISKDDKTACVLCRDEWRGKEWTAFIPIEDVFNDQQACEKACSIKCENDTR